MIKIFDCETCRGFTIHEYRKNITYTNQPNQPFKAWVCTRCGRIHKKED